MPQSASLPYEDQALSVEKRVQDLVGRMSLTEKIGQMTMADIRSVSPEQVSQLQLGAVLSGGGAVPTVNTSDAWRTMVESYESSRVTSRWHIPLLYGIDAVHGHGNVYGATIFPHNIGLGATRNPELVERIGAATAQELAATGIFWDFAPALEVPQDYRWGRTYEGFSENTELVGQLGAAYIKGLQAEGVLATAKHYVSAGAAVWGTSGHEQYAIDQGGSEISETELKKVYLPPFKAALQAGAKTVMVSLNSWRLTKIHIDQHLLTDILKTELGFTGFVVSDWDGLKSLGPDYHANIVRSVNAGLDMVMLSKEPEVFIHELTLAVDSKEVAESRVDDAVSRILRVKFEKGYFDSDEYVLPDVGAIGSLAHRELARQAVSQSAVLLKNEDNLLPLPKTTPLILVAGAGADDIGMQSGGWTMTWQGGLGEITPGTTILEAVRATVSPSTVVDFSADGYFKAHASVAIVVVGEKPYAEGVGDRADLHLDQHDLDIILRVKEKADKVVVILLGGRPMIIADQVGNWDSLVMAWLPGTEGQGLADVLFGDEPFTGKLPFTWPSSMSDLPMTRATKLKASWAYGYGLTTTLLVANSPVCKPLD
ncbi:MAG: glycoside hydrolase family 3 protein [Patescibacteria group bacterium]